MLEEDDGVEVAGARVSFGVVVLVPLLAVSALEDVVGEEEEDSVFSAGLLTGVAVAGTADFPSVQNREAASELVNRPGQYLE